MWYFFVKIEEHGLTVPSRLTIYVPTDISRPSIRKLACRFECENALAAGSSPPQTLQWETHIVHTPHPTFQEALLGDREGREKEKGERSGWTGREGWLVSKYWWPYICCTFRYNRHFQLLTWPLKVTQGHHFLLVFYRNYICMFLYWTFFKNSQLYWSIFTGRQHSSAMQALY